MSHGFVVKSDEDKVLVHSEAENLFFVGKGILSYAHTRGISFDVNASAYVRDTSAQYRSNYMTVKIPRGHPNTDSLVFFPFVDTEVFTFGVFSLQSVEHQLHRHTATHTVFRVMITVLTNTSFNPTIYLFANSPEVVGYSDTEEVNEYGVEVFKGSGTPYKVYDSSRTPLVITDTAIVRPSSRVPIQEGKCDLRLKAGSDTFVTALNSKKTLMYCPMQADGGEYKFYDESVKTQNCNTYTYFGPKRWCETDRHRYSAYGFYAYYKAVFKVKNGMLRLTYLPIRVHWYARSVWYNKRRGDAIYGEVAGIVGDTLALPYNIVTKGPLNALEDYTNDQFDLLMDWMFGVNSNIPNVFLADTINKTRNSDHNYLVLLADKRLYD